MKLRQCVFVCKDLESSREELCDILGIEVAYRDPGVAKWGLVNVVCPIGHDFLEIVTPTQPGTSAGRYIERRKGDGGYMVIIQVPDAEAERERVTGARRARRRAEGPGRIQLHPLPSVRHGGRAAVARHDLRAAGRRSGELWWPPAEKDWLKHARSDVTNGLAGVEIQAEDPDEAAASLVEACSIVRSKDDIIRLDDDGEIRFTPIVDGRGPGVSAYDVKVVDRDARARRRQEARQAIADPLRSRSAAAASTWCEAARPGTAARRD